jgi:two-component system, sensor histidine kinase and response regulator
MNTAETNAEQRVHVLIAEDSPTQAQQLKYALERHGYKVTTAVNGRQAMEVAKACKPTLVISDVLMPEMNGYQLCQAIKTDPELKNVPVILVTTLADPQDVIRGLECRADNFIIKPYDEHFLLSRIQFVKLNDDVHNCDRDETAVEIHFNGQQHLITANRLQILNLLLSTYEAAIQKNQELSRAKDSLRAVNESLQTSNEDLEAFGYSVSHDLRAPLRSISGFSRILAEECAAQLDENGKELLQRVQSACHRMEELIEGLLNFSRVARSEMSRQEVDLSALATAVMADLQKAQPQRAVDYRIAEGLSATGDAILLRSVFENLLGNAWKFTSKRSSAVIEVGMNVDGNERVFFVRDNGVGFDMQFAEKLFGAFQRMHSTNDFPGTGVGLATVQRIIRRHGGGIWAESAVGAGATFRFTL